MLPQVTEFRVFVKTALTLCHVASVLGQVDGFVGRLIQTKPFESASNNATLKTAATNGFTGRGLTTCDGEIVRVEHEFPGYKAGSVLVLIKTAVGVLECSFL